MKKISIPKDEFVREHKRLVKVLRSPSKKDDKEEADRQEKELKEEASKSDTAENIGCGTGLAGKICRHNQKKLNHFVQIKKAKMKKSIDFKDTTVSVDSKDQLLAESTTNPQLIDYLNRSMNTDPKANPPGSVWKVPFPTGILTLSQRESGVYHGHFQDRDGQVIEKFDSQTVAMIAKTLEIKSLIPAVPAAITAPDPSPNDVALSAHNRIDDLQRQLIEQQRGKSIRVKYGDFEIEIKKSLRDFINDFKAERSPDKDVVRKALSSWRKKHSSYMSLSSDQAAAKELITNWNSHQESFLQFVDALSRGDEDEQA